MVAPVVRVFAEVSPDIYAIADLITSVLAANHCSFFNDELAEAPPSDLYRVLRSCSVDLASGG